MKCRIWNICCCCSFLFVFVLFFMTCNTHSGKTFGHIVKDKTDKRKPDDLGYFSFFLINNKSTRRELQLLQPLVKHWLK